MQDELLPALLSTLKSGRRQTFPEILQTPIEVRATSNSPNWRSSTHVSKKQPEWRLSLPRCIGAAVTDFAALTRTDAKLLHKVAAAGKAMHSNRSTSTNHCQTFFCRQTLDACPGKFLHPAPHHLLLVRASAVIGKYDKSFGQALLQLG